MSFKCDASACSGTAWLHLGCAHPTAWPTDCGGLQTAVHNAYLEDIIYPYKVVSRWKEYDPGVLMPTHIVFLDPKVNPTCPLLRASHCSGPRQGIHGCPVHQAAVELCKSSFMTKQSSDSALRRPLRLHVACKSLHIRSLCMQFFLSKVH